MPSIKDTYQAIKEQSLIEKLQLLLILLFLATLMLDQKLNSIVLGISLFLLLFTFRASRFFIHRKPILIFTSGFVFSALALYYSSNRPEGISVIERQLALFFIPVFYFMCFTITTAKFSLITRFFFISMTGISAYLLTCSAEQFLISGVSFKEWFVRDNLYHSFASPIGMHATYLSLYLAIAIFIGFYEFLSNAGWWIKLLIFSAMLALVVTLTMLSSRVVTSSVLFILLFIYPFYVGKLKHKSLLIIAGFVLLFIFVSLLRESSFITSRFTEKIKSEVEMTPFLLADSTYNPVYGGEMRADRWYCAIELIKEKPLLGYGTGTEKDVLMQKYKKYNLQNAIVNHYDAHNQYLAFAIKGGIFGLIFFIMAIGYAIYLALSSRNFLYLSFIILFAIACMTENVLESNKGIFFFAFFNTLFAANALMVLHTRKNQA